ncbi:xanthine dehydrogenase family protein subunit M [Rhodoplanes serenus]|uniref:Xanthine dehydrogenase family protein subunit M n=1 Tax=Rhodoplanes serenus TaxID=200615 RepID=A0A9X4XTR1_9BRAD|nr:xanthine dehydrogenase family protein subunit M [Rhodoplanes serenus]
MKPAAFDYVRATSLTHALDLLASADPDGETRVLAGGQSLVPLMAMRLAAPARLVDINRLAALERLEVIDGRLVIGALVRHHRLATDPRVASAAPLLARAATQVAHPAIRNRGTFGGSLAHADPAAAFPACALALGATLTLASAAGRREVPATAFFEGLYQTALRPDELLVEVAVPAATAASRSAFVIFTRRPGDFPVAGLAAVARAADDRSAVDRLADIRLAVFGVGDTPLLADTAAAILESGPIDAARIDAAVAALDTLEIRDSATASVRYRRHLVGVALRRATAALLRPEAVACR